MSDSVLSLIDSALVYFPDFYSAALFLELKIRFLCERNRFDEAIRTVSKRKEWNLSGDSLYPYRKILLNRLKAMKGSHEQNIVDKHKYLGANIKLLQEYWDAHNDEICEYMHISAKREALKGPYFVCLLQYYRYYSALYGIDEAYKKLSELQNIEPVLLSFIEDEITRDIMLYP
ncbi:MAG: hypothetical protein IJ511_00065 [Bacteroides sp.]|nr:hypothetical protein [Bacteroides sp.]